MEEKDWTNNPKLQGIDKAKLEMLKQMAEQGSKKNQSELMSFLMAAASSGKSQGLQFNPEEMKLILEVIKMVKSKQEQERLDKIVRIMQMMRH